MRKLTVIAIILSMTAIIALVCAATPAVTAAAAAAPAPAAPAPVPAFVDGLPYEALDPSHKASKDMPILEVTRPFNLEEISFKKAFIVCGFTAESNVRVYLLLFNKDLDRYERLYINGTSGWDIGASGLFIKQIDLKEGKNQLRLLAYIKELDEAGGRDAGMEPHDQADPAGDPEAAAGPDGEGGKSMPATGFPGMEEAQLNEMTITWISPESVRTAREMLLTKVYDFAV
ncbi:MAG: hypothetical protein FWE70_03815 [Oscillospiraceae bacterium]|nr:hypothetical protein [Oscillospiraceae bacterium]